MDIKLFKFARGRGIATEALSYSIREAFGQKEMPEYVIALGEDPAVYTYLELRKE